ncbi:GNAT family N-acetyltransferase [uncultured Veillonella sp.]
MQEQGFVNEFDEIDAKATHIVAFVDNIPIGTCRFFEDDGSSHGEEPTEVSLAGSQEEPEAIKTQKKPEDTKKQKENQEISADEGNQSSESSSEQNQLPSWQDLPSSEWNAQWHESPEDDNGLEWRTLPRTKSKHTTEGNDVVLTDSKTSSVSAASNPVVNVAEEQESEQERTSAKVSDLETTDFADEIEVLQSTDSADGTEDLKTTDVIENLKSAEDVHDITSKETQAVAEGFVKSEPEAKQGYIIGRVAVVKAFRGKNIGAHILRDAAREIKAIGGSRIRLAAQVQAKGFYETLGYAAYGNEFDDEGCPHIWMEKSLK